jgi:type IX secretion system PorP/SprF family membrane protein
MKKHLILCCILVSQLASAQQDVQYNFYMFDHSIVNPAYAGSKDNLSFSLISHQQWIGITGSPKMNFLSIQAPIKKKNIGLALQILSETAGPISTTGLMGAFAYHIPLFSGKLSMALRGGMYYYTYNWSEITFKDNIPATAGYPSQKLTGTADFGINYSSRSFYLGFSSTHLNHSETIAVSNPITSVLSTHYFFEAGKAFELNPNLILNPSLLLKYVSNAPLVADLNVNACIYSKFWIGITYKTSGGAVMLTQVNVNSKLRIGYAYQYDWSRLGLASYGSHEIHVGYDLKTKRTGTEGPRIFL